MTTQKLKVDLREKTGRKVRALRASGIIPANVFGRGIESYSIQVSSDDFLKVYKEAGETSIIELTVDKKTHPVLISNIQTDPVTDEILHVDFKQVDLTQKVSATVPVRLLGESPAEKSSLGVVVQQIDEVDVEALPMDLPEHFEIDITALENVGDAIHIKDLKYDKSKVEIDADEEQIIVKVEEPQKEEEIAPVVEETEGAEGSETSTEETKEEAPADSHPEE